MKTVWYLTFILLLFSCEEERDFDPYKINKDFILLVENNNTPADNLSKIRVRVELPSDFKTEIDNKVDFTVFKDIEERGVSNIISTEVDEENKKTAEYFVSYNKADSLRVQAIIQIHEFTLSKEVYVNFQKAYLDSINISSSSLVISPNSFDEIEITTKLLRNTGVVTLNSVVKTYARDTLGNSIGIFNNYDNLTNSEGIVINKFTLGDNQYTGKLFIMSNSVNKLNEVKSDTITIYSKNKES